MKIKDNIWLIVLILVALVARTINFSDLFIFSIDQGRDALKILEIYQNKTITLLGPSLSISYQGREAFFSSISYYFELIFLFLGRFDPVISTYLYSLISIPLTALLYISIKKISNKPTALIISAIYSLYPAFFETTLFFWNPNFLLILVPVPVYFYSFKKYKLLFLSLGVLTLFHYTFATSFLITLIVLLVLKKIKFPNILGLTVSFFIGLSPMIIFELKNNFYNTRTILLAMGEGQKGISSPHYFKPVIFLFICLISIFVYKKVRMWMSILVILLLSFILIFYVYSTTKYGRGNPDCWKYKIDQQAANIIKISGIQNYNIVNLTCNTTAIVPKFLLTKDKIKTNFSDYKNIDYLFVVNQKSDFLESEAYEVADFKKSKIVQTWALDNKFNLYLYQK